MDLPLPAPHGFDTIIIGLPEGPWPHLRFTRIGSAIVFDPVSELTMEELTMLADRLHAIAEEQAAKMNPPERIMNEWWLLTQDPDEVSACGALHDCVTCRASLDQALAGMRGGRTVAVGLLAWAAPGGSE